MGSHYNGVGRFSADSKQEAMQKAQGIIDNSLYEDGHSPYSGGLGTCKTAELVKKRMSYDDADEYICENHHKWEPMMVIQDVDDPTIYYYGGWCAC